MLSSGKGFPGGSVVKNLPANAGDAGDSGSIRKIPWRRKWQPTPAFFPAWKIPWAEKPGGVQSMGWQRVGHNLVTEHTCMPSGNMKSSTSTFCLWDLCFSFFFFFWLCLVLVAALGVFDLHCGMQDL